MGIPMESSGIIHYGAGARLVIPGILHLLAASEALHINLSTGMFFVIVGLAQIFYTWPTIRRWGRSWYYIVIIGTAILITIWLGSRIPSGTIRGGIGCTSLLPIDPISIIIVLAAEFGFILLSIRMAQLATTPSKRSRGELKGHRATSA